MIHQIENWDINLFLFLNNFGSYKFDKFWLFFSNEYYWIPVYFIIFVIIIEKFGWKKALLIAVLVALMIACTDNLANIFKQTVKRFRPCKNTELDGLFRLVIENCRGTYCFFSAHASSSFASAYFLSFIFKREHKYTTFLFFGWAAMVSFSRIYVGVHFPLDVIVGTLFGLLIGWLFVLLLKKLISRKLI